jgi:hypothetical protein
MNGTSLRLFHPEIWLNLLARYGIFKHEKHAEINAIASRISPAGHASKTSLSSTEICRKDESAEAEIFQTNRRII